MKTTVLIIGGGLSGCRVLQLLSRYGIECALVESRERLGGRVYSPPINQLGNPDPLSVTPEATTFDADAPAVDLGPSWFWPDQPAIRALLDELDLQSAVYAQHADGDSVLEYAGGNVMRNAGAASMAGSLRLDGGIERLIHALTSTPHQQVGNRSAMSNTPADTAYSSASASLHLSTHATAITTTADGLSVSLRRNGQDEYCRCEHVVLALPPRLVANMEIESSSLQGLSHKLNSVPTWMAAQAKILLTYATPFWLDDGLSGDAFSQVGPMTEIHDATPRGSTTGALFGFVGVPAAARAGQEAALKTAAVQQIKRLFNTPAEPLAVVLQDWAQQQLTASRSDVDMPSGRPEAGILENCTADNRIVWAGAETAAGPHTTGLIEGAIVAAERAVRQIRDIRSAM